MGSPTLSAAVLGAVPGPPPGPATLKPRSLSTTPRRAGRPGADGPAPSAPHELARGLPGSAGLGYPHPVRRVPEAHCCLEAERGNAFSSAPAALRGPAGGHAAPCRVCRRRPALGVSVFGPGHPLRSLQQPPCPRRWRGAGVRRAQPGRALPAIFAIVLPRRRTRSLQLQTFRRPLLASASPSCRLEAGKGERFLFGPAGVRSAQTGRARRLSSPPFCLPGGAPARCSFGLVVLPLRFPRASGFRSVAYSVYQITVSPPNAVRGHGSQTRSPRPPTCPLQTRTPFCP